jgi:hypothetical protein
LERCVEEIRSRLDHPVVDSDAHFIEFMPEVNEHMRDLADPSALAAFEQIGEMIKLSGVSWRFAGLHFAFLEGGVNWACSLYADLMDHWAKRNKEDIQNDNPAHLEATASTGITGSQDIHDVFTNRYHFGCEARDPLNASAFSTRLPLGGSRFEHRAIEDARVVAQVELQRMGEAAGLELLFREQPLAVRFVGGRRVGP